MHHVGVEVVTGHGSEGAEADGEIDGVHSRAARSDGVEDGLGQVEAGGRRGHRTLDSGVDGLVALGVGQRLVDVGRQGHRAVLGRVDQQPHPAGALVVDGFADLGRRLARLGHQDGTGDEASTRPDERPPDAGAGTGVWLQQEDLGGAARRLAQLQARRQHPGLVDHEHVAGTEQVRQIGDPAMGRRRGRIEVDEQSGRIPRFDWMLGNCPIWQDVVECSR